MNNNAFPMFTTIETDYLQKLHSAKYTLDCITKGVINERTLMLICDAVIKAKRKHPCFVSQITDAKIDDVRDELISVRHTNDIQENCGFAFADEIQHEEDLEALESYLLNDHDGFIQETADAIAVKIRMIEFVEKERNNATRQQ